MEELSYSKSYLSSLSEFENKLDLSPSSEDDLARGESSIVVVDFWVEVSLVNINSDSNFVDFKNWWEVWEGVAKKSCLRVSDFSN